MIRGLTALVAVLVASTARIASACPSCASPLEENRQAFVDTTIFLTVVPLMMIGGFIWWLRKRSREMEPPTPISVPDTLLQDLTNFRRDR